MKKFLTSLFFCLLYLFVASPIAAAEFKVASENNENITIEANEKVSNLYAAANLLTINAEVGKSLYLAGNVVTINGDVEDDLKAGGSTVLVKGNVNGSAHLGGGTVTVNSKIADDLFIGGGTVNIANTAKVGGDLYIGGGAVDLQAPVVGDVFIGGGQVTINSTINGNIKVNADNLILGEKAVLKGDLTYSSPNELKQSEEATITGVVNYTKIEKEIFHAEASTDNKELGSIFGIFIVCTLVLKVIAALLSSFVLFLLFKGLVKTLQKEALDNFWTKVGLGFILMIILPIASIFLFFTLIGIWLAGLNLLIFILLAILADAMANIMFGFLIIKLFKKKNVELNWKVVLIGALSLPFISMIPIIGGLIYLIFWLFSFAELYQLLYSKILKK